MPERQRRQDRGAVGAETETPKALRGRGMGRGHPLPSRLGGLGKRRKLSQRTPGRKRFYCFLGVIERLSLVLSADVC